MGACVRGVEWVLRGCCEGVGHEITNERQRCPVQ